MAQSKLLQSSIAKKVAMALSGLFLIMFLSLHFFINFMSVFSADIFNVMSHFMGYNPLIQFVMQPILIAGVLFHFIMGIILEMQNRNARPIGYVKYNGSANAPWASRNMIYSGLVVLAFLGLHFFDFWFGEMNYKYVENLSVNETRYFTELVHKFHNPFRVGAYCFAFILLLLHLWHGFASSFQSVGFDNKYARFLGTLVRIFAVVVPVGFIFIALYHHFNQ